MQLKSSVASSAIFLFTLATCARAQAPAPAKHAITFDDLAAMQRVSDPQISPDGRAVVYSVGATDMDTNRIAHNLWIVATAPGFGRPRPRRQGEAHGLQLYGFGEGEISVETYIWHEGELRLTGARRFPR